MSIVLLFGFCLFVLFYLLISYRKKIKFKKQFGKYEKQTSILEHDLFVQHILDTSENLKVSLFIEYLEKFVTIASYANISELLLSQWFVDKDIQEIEHVLYANQKISKELVAKINKKIQVNYKK